MQRHEGMQKTLDYFKTLSKQELNKTEHRDFNKHNNNKKMKHNVLLIGSGGREHAMTWRIAQSPSCGALYVAPGNAGTSSLATNVNLDISDLQAVKTFCLERTIDLLVVGPEQPLVDGIIDFIEEELQQIAVVGQILQQLSLKGAKSLPKSL